MSKGEVLKPLEKKIRYGASILLSQERVDLLTNPADFHLRYLGRVKVKGKKNPVGML